LLAKKNPLKKNTSRFPFKKNSDRLNFYSAKTGEAEEARSEKILKDQPRNARGLVDTGLTRFFTDTVKASIGPTT
jgi:hypothetical protein